MALIGILLLWPIMLLCWLVASVDTRGNGVFVQQRVGRYGEIIRVYKIKTMYDATGVRSAITAESANMISSSGRFLRAYKLDELPQLFNVLFGVMSFVGPRPDVPGYADALQGDDRIILSIRPGITGPASLYYRDEEDILRKVDNPRSYNDEVIWPHKVRINKEYVHSMSLRGDIRLILKTIFG